MYNYNADIIIQCRTMTHKQNNAGFRFGLFASAIEEIVAKADTSERQSLEVWFFNKLDSS